MSLLFIDGFDAKDTANKWLITADYVGGSPVYTASTRFSAGFAVSGPNPSGLGTLYRFTRQFTPSAQVFVGAAIKSGIQVGQNYSLPLLGLLADTAATGHLYVLTTTLGAVQLWRGDARGPWTTSGNTYVPNGTLLATTANGVIDTNWHYVELGATISATVGTAIVKIDNTQVINFSGNTKNGGTSTNIDAVCFESNLYNFGGGGWLWLGSPVVDDLYICNALGTANNTFLGDSRIETLMPNAAGSSTQLTPTGSGTNYLNVNDIPDSTATYNGSSTIGQRDTYGLGDLVAGTGNVIGTQQVTVAFKGGAGVASLKPAQKSGATVSYGATRSLGTSSTVYTDVFETNPATLSAWTASDMNSLEAGAEVA
ncbi:MAG TPA: hypothetical protein VLG92_03650 [Candidatus Saccharimonadia bacterium]|nr:hypothetical protein [Candidatus Saccharimonadia bacterium]